MAIQSLYKLWDDMEHFDLGDSEATAAEWQGHKSLYLEKMNAAVFLREELPFTSFRLKAEVAIPHKVGFIGFIFGAVDTQNYELVYLAPVEIQYDPIMNGSMTWQIYNGARYQKALPNTTGVWQKLAIEVHPNGALVYLGDDSEPKLIVTKLQHGGRPGKIGFWSFMHSYIRDLSIEQIEPRPLNESGAEMYKQGKDIVLADTTVREWMLSEPYLQGENSPAEQRWLKAKVEENGILNVNRWFTAEPGSTVEARSMIQLPSNHESVISFGFSDHLRLWINDQEIYQGSWQWNPPSSDGRISGDFYQAVVKWQAGENRIRAEIAQSESFGWGLTLRTGLNDVF
ncbi:hypothetical protein [Paenibacillus sp. KS-LC4]|uniref:hypothetical protein n=1 Tax=Paenibacillus sp. KS-LC4 TaxID=2979727 RepID=UPI0030D552EA